MPYFRLMTRNFAFSKGGNIEKFLALDLEHQELVHTQPCFDQALAYAFQLFELLNAAFALNLFCFVDFQANFYSLFYIFQ